MTERRLDSYPDFFYRKTSPPSPPECLMCQEFDMTPEEIAEFNENMKRHEND